MSEEMKAKKELPGWAIGSMIVLLAVLVVQSGFLIKLSVDQARQRASSEARSEQEAYAVRGVPQGLRHSAASVQPIQAPVRSSRMRAQDPFASMGSSGFFDEDWDPFREMEEMQRTMNRLFRDSYSRGLGSAGGTHAMMSYDPDLDVRETEKEYILTLDLPGIDKDKISVKVQNNQIVVSGQRTTESEQSDQRGGYYRAERSFGSFSRAFPLPADADPDKMTAESKNGVLTVRIPKLEGAKKAATVPVQ